MGHLVEFSELMAKYDNQSKLSNCNTVVDFYIIYTRESHGSDKWAFSGNFDIKDATNINERIEALNVLIDEFEQLAPDINIISRYNDFLSKNDSSLNVTVLLDNMDNDLCQTFDTFPERLYIVHKNKIEFKGGIGPMFYDVKAVDVALSTMTKTNQ